MKDPDRNTTTYKYDSGGEATEIHRADRSVLKKTSDSVDNVDTDVEGKG